MIPRSARRPTRRQSRNLLGSMSLAFFTIFALILLCPVAVNADEDKKSEYGTVIGIGQYIPTSTSPVLAMIDDVSQILVLLIPALGEPFKPLSTTCQFRLTGMDSVQRGGRVEIIANDQGHRITPSWVSFSDEERL